MTKEQVEKILDRVGLEMILGDAYLDLPEVLDILQDLGYIDLERYEEEI